MNPITLPPTGLLEGLAELYASGLPKGSRTGWPSVDRLYRPLPGQLTVVTGWPGSGKSEWLDALLLNLARQGWRHAIFSPENHPVHLHLVKYLEKFVGKPFDDGPTPRMSLEEAREAATEIDDWFGFMKANPFAKREAFAVEEVLAEAEEWFHQRGLLGGENRLGLVIDPWNELEHLRPAAMSETEYVSVTLTTVRLWSRRHQVHVWLVAHPQKLRREEGGHLPIPRPDSISGSQHWWNKADNCVTVHREQAEGNQEVEIHVQKVRFKHLGRAGVATLRWDRVSGRYHEPSQQIRKAIGGRDD